MTHTVKQKKVRLRKGDQLALSERLELFDTYRIWETRLGKRRSKWSTQDWEYVFETYFVAYLRERDFRLGRRRQKQHHAHNISKNPRFGRYDAVTLLLIHTVEDLEIDGQKRSLQDIVKKLIVHDAKRILRAYRDDLDPKGYTDRLPNYFQKIGQKKRLYYVIDGEKKTLSADLLRRRLETARNAAKKVVSS